jgi:hypothetical protein
MLEEGDLRPILSCVLSSMNIEFYVSLGGENDDVLCTMGAYDKMKELAVLAEKL